MMLAALAPWIESLTVAIALSAPWTVVRTWPVASEYGRAPAAVGVALECEPLWLGSDDIDCPDGGIDGKKTPISFAVPLPDPALGAQLVAACGGAVRLAVTFRPRDCGSGALAKSTVDVWVRRPSDIDSGVPEPNLNDSCLTVLPPALVGVPMAASPGQSIPAVGEVTVRLSCCAGCAP